MASDLGGAGQAGTGLQPGGIPCPDCGQPLALPVEAVLAGRTIVCAGCGLELQVKQKASRAALAALARWYEETAPARAAAAAGATPTGNAARGRRARRPRR